MTLAEARNIMNEYNTELVKWIDFAMYCFLAYAFLNFFFILILSGCSNVLSTIKFI